MSGLDQELRCEHCVDVASYVLGSLEDHEVAALLEHLERCAICGAELVQMQAVADSLAIGVTYKAAPQSLRARIMATVHAEAELLAASGHAADRPARAKWRLAPALAATAALGAGLLIGALAINTGSSPSVRTQVIRAIVVAPGHNASAELRKAGSHLQLIVLGMPAPPRGRIYEVWLERGTRPPEPTNALFSVTSSGNGEVGVPGNPSGVSKVLVTAEPLGGSAKPTRNPIIVAST